MNKKIVMFNLFLLSLIGLSQSKSQDSTKVLYLDSLKKIKAETIFYKSGVIKAETLYYENKIIKLTFFSKEGKLLVESSYNLKGDEYGLQKEYYENGKVKKEQFITNFTLVKKKYNNEIFTLKVFNGASREYYDNGNLKLEETYNNGVKFGLSREYNEDGKLKNITYHKSNP